MGRNKDADAIRQNAESNERIAATGERMADTSISNSAEDRALQQQIFNDYILPMAESLGGVFDPEEAYGPGSEFPTIARPEFKDTIRRDYADDRANIQQGSNDAIADTMETMTASGMLRSGATTGAMGGIAGAKAYDESSARRNFQQRNEAEDMASYEDSRDLALRRHADSRSASSERAQLATAGANIMAGQQANFNPIQWDRSAQGSLGAASSSNQSAGNMRYNAAQLPSAWSTIGSVAGGALGAWNARPR